MQEEDFQGLASPARLLSTLGLVDQEEATHKSSEGTWQDPGAVIWLRQGKELWQLQDEPQNQTRLTRFCPTVCCTGGTTSPWVTGNFPAFFISHTSFQQSSAFRA